MSVVVGIGRANRMNRDAGGLPTNREVRVDESPGLLPFGTGTVAFLELRTANFSNCCVDVNRSQLPKSVG